MTGSLGSLLELPDEAGSLTTVSTTIVTGLCLRATIDIMHAVSDTAAIPQGKAMLQNGIFDRLMRAGMKKESSFCDVRGGKSMTIGSLPVESVRHRVSVGSEYCRENPYVDPK
mmetsp:Transcript_16728/g.32733  ORF Transcript_16728/g.32733 Transcript_16728/m.32733 type:complete len:113 (-) Transcript_16728:647-985(-)